MSSAPPVFIHVPERFTHAGNLAASQSDQDPRVPSFDADRVIIDLRGCEFIQPAAVMWCVVYSLLIKNRGMSCDLLVPLNLGVAQYLKGLGLFDILKESGVEVDDRGVSPSESQIVLPLTRFRSESEAEEMVNSIIESLDESNLGSANIHPEVAETFGELANNAAYHSESEIGAFGMAQFYQGENHGRFICAVADGGIGIRESLTKNPDYTDTVHYDWTAIEYATQELVSGTGDAHRGIGLYEISSGMRHPGRELFYPLRHWIATYRIQSLSRRFCLYSRPNQAFSRCLGSCRNRELGFNYGSSP